MLRVSHDSKPLERKLAQLQVNIHNLPRQFNNALKGKEGRLANEALRKITIVPGAPVHPIRWKSQRQRKAYFASKGFGKGIPSRRNYKLLKGWRVVVRPTPYGGSISMENPEPYMRFVQGADAQPFHLDTGWVQQGDVENDFLRETTSQVVQTWEVVGKTMSGDK